jgi:phosphoribosylanthranilate isomerase
MTVGVFVDSSRDEISQIASKLDLAAIQLHGDEAPSLARDLIDQGRKVIRAIKLPVVNLAAEQIRQSCRPWHDLDCHLLLDADAGKAHGGSGKCLDWQVVRQWADQASSEAWTLAGGLNDENVAAAIAISGAHSVDTASGVEQPRGTKSPQRIEKFVKASLAAFAQQGHKSR